MLIELKEKNLSVENQKPIRVFYKGNQVGDFSADIVVEDGIILELKSVLKLVEAHEVQLVNYLVATGKPVGLLINFGKTGVEVKRKYREFQTPRNSSIETMGFESSDY
jgi:GxxExxY protein